MKMKVASAELRFLKHALHVLTAFAAMVAAIRFGSFLVTGQ